MKPGILTFAAALAAAVSLVAAVSLAASASLAGCLKTTQSTDESQTVDARDLYSPPSSAASGAGSSFATRSSACWHIAKGQGLVRDNSRRNLNHTLRLRRN